MLPYYICILDFDVAFFFCYCYCFIVAIVIATSITFLTPQKNKKNKNTKNKIRIQMKTHHATAGEWKLLNWPNSCMLHRGPYDTSWLVSEILIKSLIKDFRAKLHSFMTFVILFNIVYGAAVFVVLLFYFFAISLVIVVVFVIYLVILVVFVISVVLAIAIVLVYVCYCSCFCWCCYNCCYYCWCFIVIVTVFANWLLFINLFTCLPIYWLINLNVWCIFFHVCSSLWFFLFTHDFFLNHYA